MAKKKPALGKGLNSLLSKSAVSHAPSDTAEVDGAHDGELKHVPIEWLSRGRYQPRRDMQQEALEELADSIKSQGLMQPIVVRPQDSDATRFEIIAGERRWRACQLARLDTVPVLVRDVDDSAAIAMALIENIQRENLNPMEEAIALHRLQTEFELSQKEVAEAVGKNRATVANMLRLMNLNSDVQRLLECGDIEMGHARALLGLKDEAQSQAARWVVANELTVRQTEAHVKREQEGRTAHAQSDTKSPDIARLERVLGERLGAKVAINHGAKGKGKLVINYSTLDELDGILKHIQ